MPNLSRPFSARSFAPARRRFLQGAAVGAAACLLPRPAVAAPAPQLLHARPGHASLLGPSLPQTKIWGYNGQAPGPLLRTRQGGELALTLVNQLEQPTTVHWHGIRIDNRMDGVAGLTQPAVPPGETFDYRFQLPDAGTFWYHPHNRSWDQMSRGLYGLLIVEENDAPKVDRDVPLVIDDWYLTPDAALDTASLGQIGEWAHGGRTGNVLTVNGRAEARYAVHPGERLRLRLANTANARILQLRVQGGTAQLIALDGQPLASPRSLKGGRLILPPAGRADIMLDMPAEPGHRAVIADESDLRIVLARFINGDVARSKSPLSARPVLALPPNPIPEPDLANAKRFDLVMAGGAMGGLAEAIYKGEKQPLSELVRHHNMVWAFNGVAGMPAKPLFSVKKGTTVIVRMVNNTGWPHAMHLHGHHIRAIKHTRETRSGKRELQVYKDWRDSVLIERTEEMEVAFVADNPGKWMLHCHMLEHQAGGMMTWFEVTA